MQGTSQLLNNQNQPSQRSSHAYTHARPCSCASMRVSLCSDDFSFVCLKAACYAAEQTCLRAQISYPLMELTTVAVSNSVARCVSSTQEVSGRLVDVNSSTNTEGSVSGGGNIRMLDYNNSIKPRTQTYLVCSSQACQVCHSPTEFPCERRGGPRHQHTSDTSSS